MNNYNKTKSFYQGKELWVEEKCNEAFKVFNTNNARCFDVEGINHWLDLKTWIRAALEKAWSEGYEQGYTASTYRYKERDRLQSNLKEE